jgi:hypothetical protein
MHPNVGQPGWLLEKEGKAFFLEKKKPKTFAYLAAASPPRPEPCPKVFWFFFSKKNMLSLYSLSEIQAIS